VREIRTADLTAGRATFELTIPSTAVATTASGRIRVFRGPADQAMDGIEGLLSEPHGCFEQTSSSTYPNLLVLRLLAERRDGNAAAIAKARRFVGQGYQRLISYEVEGGGFSWFGESPANQVLTAYGLMEFVDMAAVYPVDAELIARTRKWLLRKQRTDGSWTPDASWLHDWSELQGKLSTTAYIAWALAESGYRGPRLSRALGFLRRHSAKLGRDPYLLALWAAAEAAGGSDHAAALRLLAARAQKRGEHTFYSADGQTLFYATGIDADVQVTALAANALARAAREATASRAVDWLWAQRRPSYGWGTTQATVLALRAAALLAPEPRNVEGSLEVTLDGKPLGEIDLASPGVPSIDLPADLSPGAHSIALRGSSDLRLRADVRWSWRDGSEPTAIARGIRVELAQVATPSGEPMRVRSTTALEVRLYNPGKRAIAMPTVVVPIPPGFAVEADSLASLVKQNVIEKYSDLGSEIHIYLSKLAPGAKLALPYRLVADAEVDVLQRPARAYAYYTPSVSGSSEALRLTGDPARYRTAAVGARPLAKLISLERDALARRVGGDLDQRRGERDVVDRTIAVASAPRAERSGDAQHAVGDARGHPLERARLVAAGSGDERRPHDRVGQARVDQLALGAAARGQVAVSRRDVRADRRQVDEARARRTRRDDIDQPRRQAVVHRVVDVGLGQTLAACAGARGADQCEHRVQPGAGERRLDCARERGVLPGDLDDLRARIAKARRPAHRPRGARPDVREHRGSPLAQLAHDLAPGVAGRSRDERRPDHRRAPDGNGNGDGMTSHNVGDPGARCNQPAQEPAPWGRFPPSRP
jgi:hypothetical protein